MAESDGFRVEAGAGPVPTTVTLTTLGLGDGQFEEVERRWRGWWQPLTEAATS